MIDTDGARVVPCLQARYRLAFVEGMEIAVSWTDRSDRIVIGRRGSSVCPLAWSPDGISVFACTNDGITRFSAEPGSAELAVPAEPPWHVVWHLGCSTDGRRLSYFATVRTPNGDCALFTANVDGTDRSAVRRGSDIRFASVDWKRGQALVERVTAAGMTELEVVDMASGERAGAAVVDVRGFVLFAELSPTDESIVFASPHTGVCVVSLTDGQLVKVAPEGWRPRWSPDGQWIAYVVDECEGWIASPARGVSRRIVRLPGHDALALNGASYARPSSWSPDGCLVSIRLTRMVRREGAAAWEPSEMSFEDRMRLRDQMWRPEFVEALVDLQRNEVSSVLAYRDHVAFAPAA